MCKVYKFQFSLDSIKRREILVYAELRLYVSSVKTRTSVAAKVSIVRSVGQLANAFKFSSNRISVISPSVIIYGDNSRWVTFNITSIVQKRVRTNEKLVNLDACLENIYQNEMLNNFYIESLKAEYSPVLVVYSNERKRRKRAPRNKQDLIAKEVILDQFRSSKDPIRPTDRIDSNVGKHGRTITMKPGKSTYRTPSKRRWRQSRRKSRNFQSERNLGNLGNDTITEFRTSPSPRYLHGSTLSRIANITFSTISQPTAGFQGDDPLAVSDRGPRVARTLSRTLSSGKTRKKGRKRPRKKTPCSRSPMYVDFEKIGWDSWIIAPKGYDVSTKLHIFD